MSLKSSLLTSIISPNVGWVEKVAGEGNSFLARFGVIPNSDSTKPTKLWADLRPAMASQNQFSFPVFDGSESSNVAPTFNYKIIARDEAGNVKLTPLESPDFLRTYSSMASVIATYRRYAFMFTKGVPFLVDLTLPSEIATQYNPNGTLPVTDYPLTLPQGGNLMLVPSGTSAVVCDYQDFIAYVASVVPSSAHDKVVAAIQYLQRTDISDEAKILAATRILENSPTFVIT